MTHRHKAKHAFRPTGAIDPTRVSNSQRKFLAYMIRRYKGDLKAIGFHYYRRGTKDVARKMTDLVARCGLLPYQRMVRWLFGKYLGNMTPPGQYTVYVHKFKDHGVDEHRLAPWHEGAWGLNPEFLEEDDDEG